MNKSLPLALFFAGISLGTLARAGAPELKESKVEVPAEPEPAQPWRFSFSAPAWTTWQQGTLGINGANSKIKLGPNDIIPKVDLAAVVRANAQKGRFGIMAEYMYMDLSDGVGANGLVKKLDTRTDQHQGELALSWRVIEGERGWLDVFAGARWTNMFEAVQLHEDDGAINEVSTKLVDDVAAAVRAALDTAINQKIATGLVALQNRRPLLPQGPIADGLRAELLARLRTILAQRRAELNGAIASGIQQRIDDTKRRLSNEIARTLKDELNKRVSRTDQWVDPFVGFKGRYYLSKPVYLTGRADIGGFDVGAKISWQVDAGIGVQLSKHVYSELTGRGYYVDYDNDGYFNRTFTYGVELTTGINF